MRRNLFCIIATLLMCVLLGIWFQIAYKPLVSYPSSHSAKLNRGGDKERESIKSEPTSRGQVQAVAKSMTRLLENMKESSEVDLGALSASLDQNGFRDLKPTEKLEVIGAVIFGNPADERSQGPYFFLENAAEILRNEATDADVDQVVTSLHNSATDEQVAKWLKVLEMIGHAGNQQAYINLLKQLPDGEPEEEIKAEAEVIGRVLGKISTVEAVAALLNEAESEEISKKIAVANSIGYVGSTAAIKSIAELIDGPAPKGKRQMTAAVKMLGYIPSEYSVISLLNLSTDSDVELAATAKESLNLLVSNNPALKSADNP